MATLAPTEPDNGTPSGTGGRVAWAFYDFGNSAFATLIVTFVFAAYFSQGIVGDDLRGQQLWGTAASLSGLAVALLAPVLGAIADAGGRRKPWLGVFTAAAVIGSAMLWWAEPSAAFIVWAMVWYAIANIGIEFGVVFNNAMLPDLVAPARMGRWSGWGWGLGYAGGLLSMGVALVLFVQADPPLFGLERASAEHVRVVGPLAGLWLAAFALPPFLLTPDRAARREPGRVRAGFATLVQTLRHVRRYGNVVRFLLARMLYADGLATVFVFGGIFAAGAFGMELQEVLLFGIVLNLTAGVGAFAFGWIDDWLGPRRTILVGLAGLFLTAAGALSVHSEAWFWFWGGALGVFVGPTQAASRSLMARLAPPHLRTEFFGLFALSGKATAFAGPAVVAALTAATASQRWGLSVLLLFFAAGGALLLTVREDAAT